MGDLRPLKCSYHNCKNKNEKKMVGFIIDLFELGVSEALNKFLFSGHANDHLSTSSATALVHVLNSDVGGPSKKRRRSEIGVGEFEAGAKKLKKVSEMENDGGRVIVCALPAIRAEDMLQVKVAVTKARATAEKKGKKVAEEKHPNKFGGRLTRNMRGVPWQRGVKIEEPREDTVIEQPELHELSSDSSCKILGVLEADDDVGPSAVLVLDDDADPSEPLMSDADVQRANFNLLDLLHQLPPSEFAKHPEFH